LGRPVFVVFHTMVDANGIMSVAR